MTEEKWITLDFAEVEYGFTKDEIYVKVSGYKKDHGTHPSWYMPKKKGETEIDIAHFERMAQKRCAMFKEASSPEGLFFALTELYDMTPWTLAEALAKKTGRSQAAWSSWLRTQLFSVSVSEYRVKLSPRTTENILEFIHYGNVLLESLRKNEQRSWEDYYRKTS